MAMLRGQWKDSGHPQKKPAPAGPRGAAPRGIPSPWPFQNALTCWLQVLEPPQLHHRWLGCG